MSGSGGSPARTEKDYQQFVYAVSHDLQEPLSKIITISELLAEKLKTLDATEKDYLIRMCEAGRRMKTLIDDLTRQWLTPREK